MSNRIDDFIEQQLQGCQAVYPESQRGACDGAECSQPATIHDLSSGMEWCSQHYGRELEAELFKATIEVADARYKEDFGSLLTALCNMGDVLAEPLDEYLRRTR